jgi:hypothetical protein
MNARSGIALAINGSWKSEPLLPLFAAALKRTPYATEAARSHVVQSASESTSLHNSTPCVTPVQLQEMLGASEICGRQ